MATKAKSTVRKARKKKAKAAKGGGKGDGQLYPVAKVYKSPKKVSLESLPPQFSRADLEFIGVDHSGPSYEARVFINNPNADENTPTAEESGYAGSFNIFGHGGCFGDVGHCEINGGRDAFDQRPTHPLMPIRKVVIATDAIKKAAAQGPDITVTVVPLVKSWTEKTDLTDVLVFDHINLVTYD
jgi:tyrosinase